MLITFGLEYSYVYIYYYDFIITTKQNEKKRRRQSKSKPFETHLKYFRVFTFMLFLIIFPFLNFQSQQGELDLLNKKTQEILREADPINRSNIEQENTQINKDWKDVVDSLENRVEALAGLAQHWEDFDKRIHAFESQLTRLDERNRNVDQVVRSRRHLEDTKNVVQVSVLGIPFGYHYYLLFFIWRKKNLITEKLWYKWIHSRYNKNDCRYSQEKK